MDDMGYGVMRVLVTGAQGYLGKQVIKSLSEINGISVIPSGRHHEEGIYNCDLTNIVEVKNLIKQTFPDRIVHCAASVPKSNNDYSNSDTASTSLLMLDTLLSESECPIIFISSMTVYGEYFNRPVSENDAGNPTSEYGQAKLEAENLLKIDGRAAVAIRIPGLFGLPRRNGLIFNLLNSFKYDLTPQLPKKPVIWAAMHVNDAAQAIAKITVSKLEGFLAINCGYRDVYSIKNLFDIACELHSCKFAYNVNQPDFEYNLSLASKFDAVPTHSFKDVISKFSEVV
jgi:nucleoside-diphosphate-sugar epimerase